MTKLFVGAAIAVVVLVSAIFYFDFTAPPPSAPPTKQPATSTSNPATSSGENSPLDEKPATTPEPESGIFVPREPEHAPAIESGPTTVTVYQEPSYQAPAVVPTEPPTTKPAVTTTVWTEPTPQPPSTDWTSTTIEPMPSGVATPDPTVEDVP